ncbi:conserved hypothetical protein [Hyella patelloides LEGE 07179]|uniref:Leucine rich repeat variant n=1 Tax=Hyella patelloides LEGE 07179 TaxID=945734 RepID=A0A563W3V5_9CYAN|nr:hypothetical protein [Hyella patelloides]VEP18345.1 conserved hypothetical protein [Hyella patelloides LEGE 07179]
MAKVNNNDSALIAEAKRETTSQKRLKELASIDDNLARIVAQNIAASPELLSDLATRESKTVRKAVTSNPNTPKKILFILGVYFPQELLNNPIFDFSLLGDLTFIKKIPSGVLSILIQQNNAPLFLLNYAANHPATIVANTAKMHVSISGEITQGWHKVVEETIQNSSFVNKFIDDFNGVVWDFRYGARCRGDFETPQRSFKLLTNFYEFIQSIRLINQLLKGYTAQNPSTKSIILEQLACDENSSIRRNVAENPSTPPETLELLAKDSNNGVRNSAAGNHNTSISILQSLATDPDINIRYRVAGNPTTPLETLKLLANDSYYGIRRAIAGNSNTPAEILKLLARDSHKQVREYVAGNSCTPPETLELLAKESDYTIRYRVAVNPNTPENILKSFGCNYAVTRNPNLSIEILESLIDYSDKQICYDIAKNPSTPVKILKMLACDSNDQIREYVADNPNVSVEILKLFAIDRNSRIRFRVARNPNTPINLLELLANDFSNQIRVAIAKNPNTPIEILESLANDSDLLVRESVSENPKCTRQIKETIFKNFAKSETPSFSRVALFLSDYAESSVLAENSNSISWLERYAIAQNKQTPQDTLEILAQDGNRIVRATAKESLQKLYDKGSK